MSTVLFGLQTPFSSADLQLTRHCPSTCRQCWLIPRGRNPVETQRVVSSATARVSWVGGWHRCPPVCVVLPIGLLAARGSRSGCLWKRKGDPCARKSSFLCPFGTIDSIHGYGHTRGKYVCTRFPTASLSEIAEDWKQPARPIHGGASV